LLIAQQTAANLHVSVGDPITITRMGLPPLTVRIDGVIDLPQADMLFQAVGVPPGAAPQAPPDNVLVVPMAIWHQWFDQQAVVRRGTVRTQLHVRLDHTLPPDPRDAYVYVQQLAHNFEARVAGSAMVGDNLAARLDAVREDALYARVLFLFLGLPGAILAIILTFAVSATGGDRRRREQALLRVRGATTSMILRLESLEASVVSIAAVIIALIITLADRQPDGDDPAGHAADGGGAGDRAPDRDRHRARRGDRSRLARGARLLSSCGASASGPGERSILGEDVDRSHHAGSRGPGVLAHRGSRLSDRSRTGGRRGDVGVLWFLPGAARALDRSRAVGDENLPARPGGWPRARGDPVQTARPARCPPLSRRQCRVRLD